jgi:hypothetical protein
LIRACSRRCHRRRSSGKTTAVDSELLSAASAVGQEFSTAAVAAASRRSGPDVALRCDALAHACRFVERAEGRALVAEVHGSFAAGFDTHELREARALIATE